MRILAEQRRKKNPWRTASRPNAMSSRQEAPPFLSPEAAEIGSRCFSTLYRLWPT